MFTKTKAYQLGYQTYTTNHTITIFNNPYPPKTQDALEWLKGIYAALADHIDTYELSGFKKP